MKFSYQIFIILFVIASLFVIKDDIKPIYNRIVSYIEHSSQESSTSVKSSREDQSIINTGAPENITKLNINTTPGPLKVLSDAFTTNAKSILSVNGVLNLTNKNRSENGGLSPLKENSKLDISANMKLKDMFAKQYFEHISPNGVGVADLGADVSYDYIIIGENLALGNFASDKALVDAWMASPGHRANILNTHYTEIGVAVGYGMFNGRNVWLAVQHFGLPKDACPSTDEVLHGKITLDQKHAKNLENDLAVRRGRIDSGVVYEGKTTNEQISEYNDLVAVYNKFVIDLKQEINTYNIGIRALNSCIADNTKSH